MCAVGKLLGKKSGGDRVIGLIAMLCLVHGQGGADDGVARPAGGDGPLGRHHRGEQRPAGSVRSGVAGRGPFTPGHTA
eukprot:5076517-Pyramimonas_sp.AAC.1